MKLYTHFTANNIKLTEMPFVQEIAMEGYLIENESVLAIDEETLSEPEILDAEITLSDGRKSLRSDGRIDLLAIYNLETPAVIELKKQKLENRHLEQLEDYFEAEDELLKIFNKNMKERKQSNEKYQKTAKFDDLHWIGILVGNEISPDLEKKISEGYQIKGKIPLAALTVKRFRGNDNNIYVLTNVFFKDSGRKLDYTKYKFNGEIYNKGKLVLAVLKEHVSKNPEITYNNLENDFPKSIRKDDIIVPFEDAKEIHTRTGHKRHYINQDEIIEVKGQPIAISNQWTKKTIEKFIEKCKELGYEITAHEE